MKNKMWKKEQKRRIATVAFLDTSTINRSEIRRIHKKNTKKIIMPGRVLKFRTETWTRAKMFEAII